jgi:hypothetical protein
MWKAAGNWQLAADKSCSDQTPGFLPVASSQQLSLYRFKRPMARQIQPATNERPPMGVIAPIPFTPVRESRYKLPENRMMPAMSNIPALPSRAILTGGKR